MPHCGHSWSGSFCNRRYRLRSDTITVPHRSSMKLNSVTPTRYSEQKLRVTISFTPLRPFHAFLTFSSSFSSVNVVEQLKRKASNKKNGSWEFLRTQRTGTTKTLPWLPVPRTGGRIPCLTPCAGLTDMSSAHSRPKFPAVCCDITPSSTKNAQKLSSFY